MGRIGAGFGDQSGRANGPGVHQTGAERIGPVERARMQQPVIFAQGIPAVMHHLPGPDRAMGVGHGAGIARGARGINDITKPLGVAHGIGAGRQVTHCAQPVERDAVGMRRAGDLGVQQDRRRFQVIDHLLRLALGQLRRGRHRNDPGGNGAKVGNREIDRIAQPHEDDIAGFDACLKQPGAGAAHGGFQRAIGPVGRSGWPQHRKRDLVRQFRRAGQHMGGHVERSGAGRKGAFVENRKHGAG